MTLFVQFYYIDMIGVNRSIYLVVCFFIVRFMCVDFYGINGFMLSFVEAKSDVFVILLFIDVPCSEMSCTCFLLPLVDGEWPLY